MKTDANGVATPLALREQDFKPAELRGESEDYNKNYDLEGVSLSGFTDIHKYEDENYLIYLGLKDGYWHILDERIGTDECSYLAAQSKPLRGMPEIAHAVYFRFGFVLPKPLK